MAGVQASNKRFSMPERRDSDMTDLLRRADWEALGQRAACEAGVLRSLLARTYDPDELIAWRAVDAIGRAASVIAGDDVERVRRFIRRLLWSMNDESGGVGWHAPEALGEILVHRPALIDEYGVLLPSYLHEPPFERGAHLAVWRVATVKPDPLGEAVGRLERSVDSEDAAIRGFAILALGVLAPATAREHAAKLLADGEAVTAYDFEAGDWTTTAVGDMARAALAR